jgi:hypothetical protein
MTLNSILESEGNGRVWTGCEAAIMGDTGHRP